jgi:hypothetical protein
MSDLRDPSKRTKRGPQNMNIWEQIKMFCLFMNQPLIVKPIVQTLYLLSYRVPIMLMLVVPT